MRRVHPRDAKISFERLRAFARWRDAVSCGSLAQAGYPRTARLRDLAQNVAVRSPRTLEDMEAVIGAFQPVHRPPVCQTPDHPLHQIAPAKCVAGAVEAKDRHFDSREVRVAKLFGLACRMQGVGEEQQAVAGKSVRREHRSRPSAHRPSAENEGPRRDLAARVRRHGGDAFL